VLETRFTTDSGEAALVDFMPLTDDEEKADVVRIVRGIRGEVELRMELILRFNYGQAVPWVRRRDYGLSAIAGPDAVELHTDVPLVGRDMTTCATFTVREGDSVPFTLSYHLSHKMPHFVPDRQESLDRTVLGWREWTKRCRFGCADGRWNDAVVRSLITLKLLTFEPTGGIVAAPTTSLPEKLGGSRNWDYRLLLDPRFHADSLCAPECRLSRRGRGMAALAAARGCGPSRAAAHHVRHLGRALAAGARAAVARGLRGERAGADRQSRRGAAPARRLWELMDVLHAAREAELAALDEAWRMQKVLLAHLEKVWREPDHGIWETRGDALAFTHSRLMSWVAFDRGVKSCERFELEGPVERWRALRAEIHDDVCANAFDAKRNTFVQHYGGAELDAALLLIPQTGFLPADDSAYRRHRRRSGAGAQARQPRAALLEGRRGPQREGAFIACSFWLADVYVMQGRIDEATELFDGMLDLRNDVGLLSEEYDLGAKRLIGNFPQGFSHIGVINTAFNLVKAHGPARQRAERVAPTDGNDRKNGTCRPPGTHSVRRRSNGSRFTQTRLKEATYDSLTTA
jgi:GH15 family glucan-1,4-alpha-glucosidase